MSDANSTIKAGDEKQSLVELNPVGADNMRSWD